MLLCFRLLNMVISRCVLFLCQMFMMHLCVYMCVVLCCVVFVCLCVCVVVVVVDDVVFTFVCIVQRS